MTTASGLLLSRQLAPFFPTHSEVPIEATSEQRQRLLEAIFRRNAIRRRSNMPSLDITKCYAHGLNRVLKSNLGIQGSKPTHNKASMANDEHGVVLPFDRTSRQVNNRAKPQL